MEQIYDSKFVIGGEININMTENTFESMILKIK